MQVIVRSIPKRVLLGGLAILFSSLCGIYGAALAEPGAEFGSAFVGLHNRETRETFLRFMRNGKIPLKWLRITRLDWEMFEPEPPFNGVARYHWDKLDETVAIIQKEFPADVNLIVVVHPTSQWAASSGRYRKARAGGRFTNVPPQPENLAHWQRALEALFDRYNFDGKNDMPGLKRAFKHWQIGNEYMTPFWWDGTAEEYREVLKAAYAAKQKIDPSIEIILCGLVALDYIAKYERGMFDKVSFQMKSKKELLQRVTAFTKAILGYAQYFDFVDVHVFNYFRYDPEMIPTAVNWLKEMMAAYGYSKPYGALEWTAAGTQFDYPNREVYEKTKRMLKIVQAPSHPEQRRAQTILEEEQAKDLARVMITLMANGLERNLYTQFRDFPEEWKDPIWDKQGLFWVTAYKQSLGGPKPAFFVFSTLLRSLQGFKDVKRISLGESVYGYKFSKDKENVYTVWTLGESTKINLRDLGARSSDLTILNVLDQGAGAQRQLDGGNLPLTDSPVLLVESKK